MEAVKFHLTTSEHHNYLSGVVQDEADRPSGNAKLLRCNVGLGMGATFKAWAWGSNIIIGDDRTYLHYYGLNTDEVEVEPFVEAEPQGKAYHRKVQIPDPRKQRNRRGFFNRDAPLIEALESYGGHWTGDYNNEGEYVDGTPYAYLNVKITHGEQEYVAAIQFERPNAGTVVGIDGHTAAVRLDFYGLAYEWTVDLRDILNDSRWYHADSGWHHMHNLLVNYTVPDKGVLWDHFLAAQGFESLTRIVPTKGIKALEKQKAIKPNLDRLATDEPRLFRFYQWLHDESGKGGVSNNQLLGAFLREAGQDYDSLVRGLREAMDIDAEVPSPGDHYGENERGLHIRPVCYRLPGAHEKQRERLAKKDWSMRKGQKAQAEGLGVDPERHPLTLKAVESGDIPLGTFHEPGRKDALINTEFDLWEKALAHEGWAEPLSAIARSTTKRTTYEKNVTPYITFLFRLEQYLDQHTPKKDDQGRSLPKWRAMPKFVNSEWELEMDEAEEEETTKRRSALTPVADNELRVVTVPYVALRISGVQTTYCYSLMYQVFEDNHIDMESKSPIVNAVEVGLNGRDDYGLMYYTLTGSARNTGYPAFLIIFERLGHGYRTRVHFHRVHPCRSKKGVKTPANRLIEECYRYMAGNVRADEIHAQQGDLIFIRNDTQRLDWEADGKPVREFESHAFMPTGGRPIKLIPNEAKSIKNRLGFIHCEANFMVDHPEHDPLTDMPAGTFEVRRCKSWEANPRAVWVLTID